jgi:protein TonB
MSILLSEFPRRASPLEPNSRHRLAAALLAALPYALFILLAWWSTASLMPPRATEAITAIFLRDDLRKKPVEPPPVIHLIRPKPETAAPPVFTIATGAPREAPAPLPASAAKDSPMIGGTSGTGPMGQSASGNGAGGNGGVSAGCLDPVWMRAVSDRVRQFFYYPGAALAVHTTGVTILHFVVRRDGRIDRLAIGKSSGDAGLDKAALDILQKAQPLPPIPGRMQMDRVEGDLPVNFGVRNFNAAATAGHCGG